MTNKPLVIHFSKPRRSVSLEAMPGVGASLIIIFLGLVAGLIHSIVLAPAMLVTFGLMSLAHFYGVFRIGPRSSKGGRRYPAP